MAISKRLVVIDLSVFVVVKPYGAGKLPTSSPHVSSVDISQRRGTCSIQPMLVGDLTVEPQEP